MSETSPYRKLIPLAGSGSERFPLIDVAQTMFHLDGLLGSPDSDWNLLYYLREVCLGREINAEQAEALIEEGLLDADGNVSPLVKAVVLSAVRGVDRKLSLDSPYTDSKDKLMSEFILARLMLRIDRSPEAAQLLAHDPWESAAPTSGEAVTDETIDEAYKKFCDEQSPVDRILAIRERIERERKEGLKKENKMPPSWQDREIDRPTPPDGSPSP